MKSLHTIQLLLLALCGVSIHATEAVAQAVTYKITISRPEGITDQRILEVFQANPDFSEIRLDNNTLTLTARNKAGYPIDKIRELLSRSGAMALEYSESNSTGQPGAKSTALKTTSFRVAGACGMCKERIERAAKTVSWVVVADWDAETYILTLRYRDMGEDLLRVHQAIAQVGHDTELVRAKDSDYDSLHHCCQYERNPAK